MSGRNVFLRRIVRSSSNGVEMNGTESTVRKNRVVIRLAARLVAAAICLAALSCAPAETPRAVAAKAPETSAAATSERSPRDIAARIDASKTALRSETRKGLAGSVDVSVTRYYVGNMLVLVEEIVGSPESGRSITAFYFDDDRLVFFRGRGTRTIFVPGGEPKRENFDIELGFDFDGGLVDSVKVIDGVPAAIEPLDYEAPKARARMLLDEEQQ